MKENSFVDIHLFFLQKVVRGYAHSSWGKSPALWPLVACAQTPTPLLIFTEGRGDLYTG